MQEDWPDLNRNNGIWRASTKLCQKDICPCLVWCSLLYEYVAKSFTQTFMISSFLHALFSCLRQRHHLTEMKPASRSEIINSQNTALHDQQHNQQIHILGKILARALHHLRRHRQVYVQALLRKADSTMHRTGHRLDELITEFSAILPPCRSFSLGPCTKFSLYESNIIKIMK